MAITNFIPEVWSANILATLRASLVFGQTGVINRNYEGDIAQAGDTVHITSFTDPTVSPYVRNSTTISYEVPDDDTTALLIDQSNYFAFAVDDLDRRQALGGWVEELTRAGAWKLAAAADAYISAAMSSAVPVGNDLGNVTIDVATPGEAYELLVNLRTALALSETPDEGRWVVVSPEVYGLLLLDARFVSAEKAGTTAGLRNGQVGRAAGFDVFESTRAPGSTGLRTVLAGHGMATTYADQIVDTESMRLIDQFGDGVRGLHLFGAKVIRPAQLAKAIVTVSGGEFS